MILFESNQKKTITCRADSTQFCFPNEFLWFLIGFVFILFNIHHIDDEVIFVYFFYQSNILTKLSRKQHIQAIKMRKIAI